MSTEANQVSYPFGDADVQELNPGAETIEVTVENMKTILEVAPTGAATIDLAVSKSQRKGAELIIEVTQPATGRNITLGEGFATNAPNLTGVANDVDVLVLVYDGEVYKAVGTWQKVVDAA